MKAATIRLAMGAAVVLAATLLAGAGARRPAPEPLPARDAPLLRRRRRRAARDEGPARHPRDRWRLRRLQRPGRVPPRPPVPFQPLGLRAPAPAHRPGADLGRRRP